MTIKFLSVLLLVVLWLPQASARSLVGRYYTFQLADTVFKNPFIDVDRIIMKPVRCRYVHGGFSDGTRFSFYFPVTQKYQGRFFQYVTPFPDSETSAQTFPAEVNPIAFSVTHGAYFVETNEGGHLDFNDPSTKRPATIGAYRANAACAQFSRFVAQKIYGGDRPFGYCFGGSGGAYRTTGSMESTKGVWDGAVPFVLGSPQAIPNVFAVRMYALRVLKDKMGDIVDALEPGGSGNPYATLTAEQRQVLQECTRMGFPIRSWYGWKEMDAHGFLVLYQGVVAADPTYFHHDFWNVPGYQGYDNPPSLQRDHVQQKAVVRRIIGQDEAERLGLVEALSAADRGSADKAWASMGSDVKEKPVVYEVDANVPDIGMGGDLILLNGKGAGKRLQITGTKNHYVILAPINAPANLTLLHVGDSVQVDNSDWLAVQTYYRHQVPSKDYYVWNQFRGVNDVPIYPQRPFLLGPHITQSAAGCLPEGKIHGKMILVCNTYDREAFAWQGDWYRNKVKEHLGDKTDNQFRLWYTDKATHGNVDDPTEIVDYNSILYQALLDVSAWVEKGIEPSKTSDYSIQEGQVVLAEEDSDRGGIQPVVVATVDGKQKATVKTGQPVTIHVKAVCPKGTGKVVEARWMTDNTKTFNGDTDLSKATYSNNDETVEFDYTVSYDSPGTYFPTVRIGSEREGNAQTTYTRIYNLGKVRVVVE